VVNRLQISDYHYINLLVEATCDVSCVKAADCYSSNGIVVTHDTFNRFLTRQALTPETLWNEVAPYKGSIWSIPHQSNILFTPFKDENTGHSGTPTTPKATNIISSSIHRPTIWYFLPGTSLFFHSSPLIIPSTNYNLILCYKLIQVDRSFTTRVSDPNRPGRVSTLLDQFDLASHIGPLMVTPMVFDTNTCDEHTYEFG